MASPGSLFNVLYIKVTATTTTISITRKRLSRTLTAFRRASNHFKSVPQITNADMHKQSKPNSRGNVLDRECNGKSQ